MAQIRLSDSIDEWLTYVAGNYARNSAKTMKSSLISMLTSVGNVYTPNLTSRHIDMWIDERQAAGIAPQSRQNNLYHVKQWAEWARSRKHAPRTWDPIGRRRTPRYITKEFRRVPVSQFPDLLDAALDPRDRMVIAIGLYMLLRASEVKVLTVGDVHLDEGCVTVRVLKSGKKDRMPISTELHEELTRWLAFYRRVSGELQDDWFLVPSREKFGVRRLPNGRLIRRDETEVRYLPTTSPTKVHEAVKHALEELGWDATGEGVHTLRRSAARARFDVLVKHGYDGALRQVQTLLHHSTAATTERYLGTNVDIRARDTQIRGQRMYDTSRPAPRLAVVQ